MLKEKQLDKYTQILRAKRDSLQILKIDFAGLVQRKDSMSRYEELDKLLKQAKNSSDLNLVPEFKKLLGKPEDSLWNRIIQYKIGELAFRASAEKLKTKMIGEWDLSETSVCCPSDEYEEHYDPGSTIIKITNDSLYYLKGYLDYYRTSPLEFDYKAYTCHQTYKITAFGNKCQVTPEGTDKLIFYSESPTDIYSRWVFFRVD